MGRSSLDIIDSEGLATLVANGLTLVCAIIGLYVLDWRLNHRTEEDMNRLFLASRFKRPATAFRYEDQQINLFASCVRS